VRSTSSSSYRVRNDPVLSELAHYHSEHAGSLDAAHATYIIGGEPCISYLDSVRDADEMTVDHEGTDDGSGSEDVLETKITLISEADLESTTSFPFARVFLLSLFPFPTLPLASKEQYTRIHFVHIYSLSPSPIHEPALLCEPAKCLREEGKSLGAGFTVALGRITGPDWHIKVHGFRAPSHSKF